MKRLIINADDFGYDADTYSVTSRLMERGLVRSTTLLVGYPEADAAMRFAKAHAKDFSFGLHFNIAEQRPLSRDPVPSLVDSSGQFRGAIVQRARALAGLLNAEDIASEATAQLSILADHGVTPSHIDSHGHFHKFPSVFAALLPVLSRFGIKRARRPQTLFDNPAFYSNLLDAYCNRGFQGALSTNHFFNTRRHDSDWFNRFICTLPKGTTELGIHPGHKEAWRSVEASPFEGSEASDLLHSNNIEVISYFDL